jgi:DNA-binding Lrp family transcriptional regulator
MKALENQGVIRGYHAHIDPEKVGLGVVVFVSVTLDRKTTREVYAFEDKIREEYRKIKRPFPPTARAHPVAPRAPGRLPNPAPGGWPCALPAARRPQDG